MKRPPPKPDDWKRWYCRYCGASLFYMLEGWPCLMCAQNSARAERLKIECGTYVHYRFTVGSVGNSGAVMVGAQFLCELYMRLRLYGGGAKPNAHQRKACWLDEGYVIDAPELMPAGGCISQYLHELAEEPEEERYLPMQLTFNRETA